MSYASSTSYISRKDLTKLQLTTVYRDNPELFEKGIYMTCSDISSIISEKKNTMDEDSIECLINIISWSKLYHQIFISNLDNINIVRAYLKSGINVNFVDNNNKSILYYATRNTEIFKLLIDYGFYDIFDSDVDTTALVAALYNKKLTILKILLDLSITKFSLQKYIKYINQPINDTCETPIMFACRIKNIPMIELLLSYKYINLNKVNKYSSSIYDMNPSQTIIEMLDTYDPINPIQYALLTDDINISHIADITISNNVVYTNDVQIINNNDNNDYQIGYPINQ